MTRPIPGAKRPGLPESSTMATVMLLLAHPRATSYCHALAERIGERLVDLGHEVRSHDLYAELFDPVLTAEESHTSGEAIESILARENDPMVALHREELRRAEGLVVVHPNWWGMPPAILTGWIDRVVVPGVAYRLEEATGYPEPLAPIAELFVVNTSDTTDERERDLYKDPSPRSGAGAWLPTSADHGSPARSCADRRRLGGAVPPGSTRSRRWPPRHSDPPPRASLPIRWPARAAPHPAGWRSPSPHNPVRLSRRPCRTGADATLPDRPPIGRHALVRPVCLDVADSWVRSPWFQLAASVLAAVTAAWIASSLGVAGTLVGAAVGSAVVTLTSAFYARTLDKGRTLLVTTASGTVIQRRVDEDDEIARPLDQAAEEAPVKSAEFVPDETAPRLQWKTIVVTTVVVLALALAAISTYELVTGRDARRLQGHHDR